MKIEKLKVGTKIGSELAQVEVNVRIPETPEEMMSLARNSLPFVVQMFVRGWRIWNQEQSGARDRMKTSTAVERKDSVKMTAVIQEIVDNADPLAPAQRTGRPARPQEVTLDSETFQKVAGDMTKLAELLAAQGVKIVLS